MFGYVVRRLVAGALVLIATVISTYLFFYAGPADPARFLCGERCAPARLQSLQESLNLTEPLPVQIGTFFKGLVAGRDVMRGSEAIDCSAPCLGLSFSTQDEVTDMIVAAIPVTVSVAIGGSLVGLFVGTAIGITASLRRGTAADKLVVGGSLLLTAIPYYIFALMTFLYLGAKWGLFYVDGYLPLLEHGPIDWVKSLLLAWIVLGLFQSSLYSRYSRGSMLEVLNEDFMRTAKAKGLKQRRVTMRHGLRAAIAPIVTIYGLDLGVLLAGTIFTEQIFSLEGMGLMALQSVGTQDLPVLVGAILFAAVMIVGINLITDIAYGLIDPRVRLA